MSKKTSKVVISILSIVVLLGATLFLVACNSGNGNVAGENNNGSGQQQQGQSSSGNTGSSYQGMFLGWATDPGGKDPDNLTMDYDASPTGFCFVNASDYMRWYKEHMTEEDGYNGQELTLVGTSTNDLTRIRCNTKTKGEYSGYGTIYQITPNSRPTVTYEGLNGEIELADVAGGYPGLFYSTERGCITGEEFDALK